MCIPTLLCVSTLCRSSAAVAAAAPSVVAPHATITNATNAADAAAYILGVVTDMLAARPFSRRLERQARGLGKIGRRRKRRRRQ
eukprot:ANDGO_04982.mRNA.1 hypothetical protein